MRLKRQIIFDDSDLHHDHVCREIVQHGGEQPVLVVLEPLLLGVREVVVPVHHLPRPRVHADNVTLLGHSI